MARISRCFRRCYGDGFLVYCMDVPVIDFTRPFGSCALPGEGTSTPAWLCGLWRARVNTVVQLLQTNCRSKVFRGASGGFSVGIRFSGRFSKGFTRGDCALHLPVQSGAGRNRGRNTRAAAPTTSKRSDWAWRKSGGARRSPRLDSVLRSERFVYRGGQIYFRGDVGCRCGTATVVGKASKLRCGEFQRKTAADAGI